MQIKSRFQSIATLSLAAVVLVFTIAGCDPDAARQEQARKEFDQALMALEQANLGFVPTSLEEHTGTDDALTAYSQSIASGESESEDTQIEAYRQLKLTEAIDALQRIVDNGLPAQQRQARRMIADIHASEARYIQRDALAEWAGISNRTTVLMSYFIAVSRAQSLVGSYQMDDSLLFARLKDDKLSVQENLDTYQREAKTLELEIAQLKKQIEQLREEAQVWRDKEQELKSAAFPLEGDARFQGYEQAADAGAKAYELESKAQKTSFQLDIAESKYKIHKKQIEFSQKYIDSIDKEIEDTARRVQDVSQARSDATKHQSEVEERFAEELAAIVKQYNENVAVKFTDSVATMDKAIEQLAAAASGAAGEERRQIEYEHVAKLSSKAEIYVSQALTSNDLGGKIQLIAKRAEGASDKAVMADRANTFNVMAADFANNQALAIGDAKATIGNAMALVDSITSGAAADDTLAGDAQRQLAIVERYNERLDKLNLGGYNGPSPRELMPETSRSSFGAPAVESTDEEGAEESTESGEGEDAPASTDSEVEGS